MRHMRVPPTSACYVNDKNMGGVGCLGSVWQEDASHNQGK